MKQLKYIETDRLLCKSQSYKTVYEWEDVLSVKLGLSLRTYTRIKQIYHGRYEKNGLVRVYHKLHRRSVLHLLYVMRAGIKQSCRLNCNTIPVLIDFWLKDEDLPAFYKAYKHVPLLLVTNLEVYQYLTEHNCPIPIEHWPLSLPDMYELKNDVEFKKKYDFCFLGRQNPFFARMLNEYSKKHPEFVYIENKGNVNNRVYITNRGNIVAKDTGRKSYIQMIQNTKVSCYTTPGLDESKSETTRFNQVTPRLFEMLVNGCHVIGHYPTNGADVKYYEIEKIVPNVENYEEFEHELEKMLSTPFDTEKAIKFLSNNTTSVRAEMLKRILLKHNILISAGC